MIRLHSNNEQSYHKELWMNLLDDSVSISNYCPFELICMRLKYIVWFVIYLGVYSYMKVVHTS